MLTVDPGPAGQSQLLQSLGRGWVPTQIRLISKAETLRNCIPRGQLRSHLTPVDWRMGNAASILQMVKLRRLR